MQEHIIHALWSLYPDSLQIGCKGTEYFVEPAQSLDWEAVNTLARELKAKQAAGEARRSFRLSLYQHAGDAESILGTTSDAVQLLLVETAKLVAALHQAQTLAEVRLAAEPFHDAATRLLDKIDAGTVKMPYMSKGLDDVLTDIETRATSVAEVFDNTQ
ncbi:hypothetical protein [Grimontia marina]|uniref:Uncharacterized protein n=1 Tax=Grimontia marina TaxID=646534 RepID=A0A128EZZ6_9GAMM|nr:hypothetical protein [Grimontia marina]CZF79734.1 hypothetical protein GMA8713_01107 [Grimontia marina]